MNCMTPDPSKQDTLLSSRIEGFHCTADLQVGIEEKVITSRKRYNVIESRKGLWPKWHNMKKPLVMTLYATSSGEVDVYVLLIH